LGRPLDRHDARPDRHGHGPADGRGCQPRARVRPRAGRPPLRRHRSLRLGLRGRASGRGGRGGAALHLRVHDAREEGRRGHGTRRIRSSAVGRATLSLAEQLTETRAATLALVAGLDDDDVHRPLDPIMSPLVWDLAHIAAYEDLWAVHRLSAEPLLREGVAATYD